MIIEIENNLKNQYKLDFKMMVEGIINKIPPDHIINLDRIQLVSDSPEKRNKNAYGFYYGQREGQKLPKIVVCVNNIFKGIPKPLLFISAIPNLFLAKTIYHEIAHHYQRTHHGILKKQWEKDATKYAQKMLRKNFRLQVFLISLLFKPLFFLSKIKRK